MDRLGLDAVIFPTVADIGPADADTNPPSADLAWRNGTWVANGNLAIRHFGVPTVTVPMGQMADTGMPAGLTFAGRGWDDVALLQLASAFESLGPHRSPPPRTPALPLRLSAASVDLGQPAPKMTVAATLAAPGTVKLSIRFDAPVAHLTVDGVSYETAGPYEAEVLRPFNEHRHSQWSAPWGPLIVARFKDGQAAFAEVDVPEP